MGPRRHEARLAWSTALMGALVAAVATAVGGAVAMDHARAQDFEDRRSACVSSLLELGEVVQRTELALRRDVPPPVLHDQPFPVEIQEANAEVQFGVDRVTASCHSDGLVPINSVTALWGRTYQTSLTFSLLLSREPDGQLSDANKRSLDALRDWAYTTATVVGHLEPEPLLPWHERPVPDGFEDGRELAPTNVIPEG